MTESTILKCEICGELMLARVDDENNRVFIYCPTKLRDHDIYVVNIAKKKNKVKIIKYKKEHG